VRSGLLERLAAGPSRLASVAQQLGLPPNTRALCVSTVAEILDCSRAHVYKLIEAGTLRKGTLPGSSDPRIPLSDVVKIAREAGLLDD
jgi:excisionase family DNA binding protein